MEDAKMLLKNHWIREHKDYDIRDFSFRNLSVVHSERVHPKSKDHQLSLQHHPKAVTPEGPFNCTAPECTYSCSKWQMFSRHWNTCHLANNPATASFLDVSTGDLVTLYDVVIALVQCRLCNSVNAAADNVTHAIDGGRTHLIRVHNITENYRDSLEILKDERGVKKDDTVPVPEGETPSATKLESMSYKLAHSQGLITNGRKLVCPVGPLKCLFPGCTTQTNQKTILRHWCKEHQDHDYNMFRVMDLHSDKVLTITETFKCVGLCPEPFCNLIMGNNSNYETLVRGINSHCLSVCQRTTVNTPTSLSSSNRSKLQTWRTRMSWLKAWTPRTTSALSTLGPTTVYIRAVTTEKNQVT